MGYDVAGRTMLEAIGHGLGEEPEGGNERGAGPSDNDGGGFCLLAELLTVWREDDGDVRVRDRIEAEQVLEQDLARRGIEQVRASDYVGDLLPCIVDDDGELVGPDTVGAKEGEAIAFRYAESDRAGGAAGWEYGLTGADGVFARAAASVGLAELTEAVKGGLIGIESRGLVYDAAVPCERTSFEAAQDFVRRAVDSARDVDVLDSHEPFAAVRPGVEVAGERGDERALVERAGGGGREASAIARQVCSVASAAAR